MRLPTSPPDLNEAFSTADGMFKIMRAANEECTRTDRYLHWDELRHRKPPKGLTTTEWWAGLKIRRSSGEQQIPLVDKNGSAFSFSLTPGMFEKLHLIDLKCGGSVEGPEPVTNHDTRDRYYISSLVAEAITSSQLEGAAVTRSVAKEMLRTGRKPTDKSERMILNNFLTMQKISGWKNERLTPKLILKIHKMVTRGTLGNPDQEGRLRREDEDVRVEDDQTGEVIHMPPHAKELQSRLEAMCTFANDNKMQGFLHPAIRSIILHFWLAYDHPFADGNGRTARAIFYWSMLKHKFWMFEFISISQQILEAPMKYYRAFLYTETDSNDLNYFIFHQLSVIQQAIEKLHTYIQRKSDQIAEMQQLMGRMQEFNHRQLGLLQYALRNPDAIFTVASHQNSHRVATQTARNDLIALVKHDLLASHKRGNANLYHPVKDLQNKLKALRRN
ncbi:MAG: Fic family protein [Verrucomicrobiota bacterium]